MTFDQFIGIGILVAAFGVLLVVAYVAYTFRRPQTGTPNGLMQLIRREPAIFSGLVTAAISLISAFGLQLSADQVGAIMAITGILISIAVRSQVSPAQKE